METTTGRPAIGVIGTGNMGSALVRGWTRKGEPASSAAPLSVVVYDRDSDRSQRLGESSPSLIFAASSMVEAARRVRCLVIALKPQDIESGLVELRPFLSPDHVIISTAAGVTLDRLRAIIGPGPCVYRIMPNLAVSVGEGFIALASEEGVVPDKVDEVLGLFGGLGLVQLLPEHLFDAITAVTGSGPGLLALVLEALEDGAVRVGIPRDVARGAVQQMALGTARFLLEEQIPPALLKDRVSSPAGTTIAGLAVLEDRGVRGALLRSVEAAAERGRQL